MKCRKGLGKLSFRYLKKDLKQTHLMVDSVKYFKGLLKSKRRSVGI